MDAALYAAFGIADALRDALAGGASVSAVGRSIGPGDRGNGTYDGDRRALSLSVSSAQVRPIRWFF